MIRETKQKPRPKVAGQRYRDTIFAWWWKHTEEGFDVCWEQVVREREWAYKYPNLQMNPYWRKPTYHLIERQKGKLGVKW